MQVSSPTSIAMPVLTATARRTPAQAPTTVDVAARPRLEVPAGFADALRGAIEDGIARGTSLAAELPDDAGRARAAAIDAVLDSIPALPGDDVQRAELQELHEVAAGRDAAGGDAARWHAEHGTSLLWRDERASLGEGDRQVFDRALEAMADANDTAKRRFGRPRPFDVDERLATIVPRPHGNASYPSAHTSAAVASAAIVALRQPSRADELYAAATEVAWSRVYGGAHFRSDVVEGARMGAMLAAALAPVAPARD